MGRKLPALTQAEMLSSIKSTFGASFRPDPDADLTKYRRGAPLLYEELTPLPDDSIVWVTYREPGERRYRVNGAFRIRKLANSTYPGWFYENGSSFAGEFYPHPGEEVEDLDDNGGVTRVFKAVKKTRSRT